ncbi:MAG TPA: 30S ribosomal protein S3 [Candidatus Krumholzibacteria bacterium]|nr:30S ribosomal protein S3 [Candidatus Krumholzibacteria bacterium]
MGQKTHPTGFRLGIIKDWNSKWFAHKSYADWLEEDIAIRKMVQKQVGNAGIADCQIKRSPKKVTVTLQTSRPGVVIGRKGATVDKLRGDLQKLSGKSVTLDVKEVKKPELTSVLVAEHIAHQLAQRVSFRRAMKKAIATAMRMGAKGIRIRCGGRLGGAEMGRVESYHEGSVPLHTLRADVDYGTAVSFTTYGTIGVKVWICKGEVHPMEFKKKLANEVQEAL